MRTSSGTGGLLMAVLLLSAVSPASKVRTASSAIQPSTRRARCTWGTSLLSSCLAGGGGRVGVVRADRLRARCEPLWRPDLVGAGAYRSRHVGRQPDEHAGLGE